MSKMVGTYRVREPEFEHQLELWAQSVLDGWVARMKSLGMLGKPRNTGLLARSLQYEIIWQARGADKIEYLQRVHFAFMFYGKMVEYGLGRGTDIKDRFGGGRDASSNPRKRREWLREPWKASLPVLKRLLGRKTGENLKFFLRAGFESTAETTFVTYSEN